MLNDLRISARTLLKERGFAAAAVITLALGIGATTAVFSVVYGVIFRPLPFPSADRLVQVVQIVQYSQRPEPSRSGLSPEQIQMLRTSSRTLSRVSFAVDTAVGAAMTGTATPVRLAGVQVGASLFDTLGVRPLVGRVFTEDEERASLTPDGERVVVLSYQTWTRYFSADPGVINRTVTLNGRPHRILGVMPDGFRFPSIADRDALTSTGVLADAPEYWTPLGLRPTTARGGMVPPTYALLNEGYSLDAANAELTGMLLPRPNTLGVDVVNLRDETVRATRPILLMFQSGIALVLLIACVNVVNLLRSRAVQRRQALWVRLSLGASRGALTRFALAESLLLAAAGGAIGTLLAYLLVNVVRWLPPHVVPRISDVHLDLPVLLFAAGVTIASGLAVGVFSTLHTAGSRPELHHRATPRRPSPALVVVEVAVAVLLLVTGGLLVSSSVNLSRVSLGIEPERVLTFRVNVPATAYSTLPARQALYDEVVTRLRAIPTVASVGLTPNGTATDSAAIGWPLVVKGRKTEEPTAFRNVSPEYFASLGIPVLAGREFNSADRTEKPRTVIVNEAFARRHFGGMQIVGETLTFQDQVLEVVGVVGNVRMSPDRDVPAQKGETPPQLYYPAAFLTGARAMGILRTSGNPAAIASHVRTAFAEIDPNLVVFDVELLAQGVERATVAWRLYAAVSAGFAMLAAILAAVGLYGVLSHSVGIRTREFGIRAALGANARRLISGVMREGLALTALGIGAGLFTAFLTSRYLQSLLFGVTPADSTTFAAVAVLFVAVGALACYVPARRAMRVDPVTALRAE